MMSIGMHFKLLSDKHNFNRHLTIARAELGSRKIEGQ